MNFYIADLHFGHENVIGLDNRPFSDVNEMDRTLIELWNGRVNNDDDVYIVGDFAYKNKKSEEWSLEQLKGKKHLIIGNHDLNMLKNEKAMKYFETVDKIMHIMDEKNHICLCHFPLAEWNGFYKGYYHIYAHIHNRTDHPYHFMMKFNGRALNAGCMINGYMPVTFKELVRNNVLFEKDNTNKLLY